jgi:hypothetical protein
MSPSDHHLQGVDRRCLRQGIDVDRLDPAVGRIVEDLGDAGARGGAGDHEIDVGADQRRFHIAVVLAWQQQRAGAHFARRHEGRHIPWRRSLGVSAR